MKRNSFYALSIAAIILLGFGAYASWIYQQSIPELQDNKVASAQTQNQPVTQISGSTDTIPTNPQCSGCISLNDNGKTYSVAITSRLTLELPIAGYDKTSLVITPKNSFGETFGASAEQGTWVRTFETLSTGTSTITVPALNSSYKDFRITVVATAPHDQNKNNIITQNDLNKTLNYKVGDRFLLKLGDNPWNLSISNLNVIRRVPNVMVVRGAQGLYDVVGTGTTVLSATGSAYCSPGQMCSDIAFAFKVTIVATH